jgi:hypothetical protein
MHGSFIKRVDKTGKAIDVSPCAASASPERYRESRGKKKARRLFSGKKKRGQHCLCMRCN